VISATLQQSEFVEAIRRTYTEFSTWGCRQKSPEAVWEYNQKFLEVRPLHQPLKVDFYEKSQWYRRLLGCYDLLILYWYGWCSITVFLALFMFNRRDEEAIARCTSRYPAFWRVLKQRCLQICHDKGFFGPFQVSISYSQIIPDVEILFICVFLTWSCARMSINLKPQIQAMWILYMLNRRVAFNPRIMSNVGIWFLSNLTSNWTLGKVL
jgi:hypothetical protein